MRRYLDTSLWVGALTDEPRWSELRPWISAQPLGSVHISWWSVTEFRSAIAKQVRIDPSRARLTTPILATFDRLVTLSVSVLSIDQSHFAAATGFVARPEVNLRSSDALHLAVAAAHGLELVTLDKRMATGGVAVGVPTLLL